MDEIAKCAGKGKSTIYYYYRSKEEIYVAVIEKEASILHEAITFAAASQTNPENKLKAYISTRLQTFHELANFYVAIKGEYLSNLEFVNKIREKHDKMEIHFLSKIIQQGVDANQFEADDAELTAIAIVTALKGLELPIINNHEPEFLRKRIEYFVKILFNGILKK
jgi:AcrR family transcriptional regulator